ncbi:MAG: hypothetical protein BWY95_01498 [Bacteroidetes bacterium ADurb.BinA104]|nr:MAG: hypothetical protein BWY95_01498 [Bacteroidetes bacterium ADurb.BinA104]
MEVSSKPIVLWQMCTLAIVIFIIEVRVGEAMHLYISIFNVALAKSIRNAFAEINRIALCVSEGECKRFVWCLKFWLHTCS